MLGFGLSAASRNHQFGKKFKKAGKIFQKG
jgi:hypothetical protein